MGKYFISKHKILMEYGVRGWRRITCVYFRITYYRYYFYELCLLKNWSSSHLLNKHYWILCMFFQLPKFVENRYRVPRQLKSVMACTMTVIISRGQFSLGPLNFCVILQMEVQNAFVLDYLFKDVYLTPSLGREKYYFLQEPQAGRLMGQYKRFEFSKLKVLLSNATDYGCKCVVFFKFCCGNWGLRNGCKCWCSVCE